MKTVNRKLGMLGVAGTVATVALGVDMRHGKRLLFFDMWSERKKGYSSSSLEGARIGSGCTGRTGMYVPAIEPRIKSQMGLSL